MMQRSQVEQGKKVIVKVDAEIKDIIPIFFEKLLEEIESALDSLQKDDYESIQIWGHSLKGAGVGYGFDTISEIGKSLDRADRAALGQSTQQALESSPSGQSVSWNNPDSGHYGTVVPEPAIRQSSGEYCREYQQTIVIDGQTEQAHGRACRQPDGTWKIVQ